MVGNSFRESDRLGTDYWRLRVQLFNVAYLSFRERQCDTVGKNSQQLPSKCHDLVKKLSSECQPKEALERQNGDGPLSTWHN